MKINDFFVFRDNTSSSTFRSNTVDLKTNQEGIYDEDNLITGNYKEITFPVVFKQFRGKKLLNLLGTGWPRLYLISDKMKTVLEENHLTGWKTFPIKLYDKKENEIFGYQGFSVTGRCGPIDYKKAEIADRQMTSTGPVFKVYKGLYVGLDKWDGSDFFIPGEALWFIVTEKTANILKKDKTLNVRLTNCADFETDVDLILNKD